MSVSVAKALKVGDQIAVVRMYDPDPVLPGTQGTVTQVDDFGPHGMQVAVDWDNGRTLSLIVPPDEVKVVARVAQQYDANDPDLPTCCRENLRYGRPPCCVREDAR